MAEKRKILVVTRRAKVGVGGAETQLLSLVRGLSPRYQLHVTYENGPLLEDFVKAGVTICPITITGKFDFTGLLRLRRYAKHSGIDLINSQGPDLDWISALVALSLSRPLIITRHSDISWFVRRSAIVKFLFRIVDFFSLTVAKTVITVSNKGQKAIETFASLARTRVVCIHNAINISYGNNNGNPDEWAKPLNKVVGMVAQMTVDKGYDTLIQTAVDVVKAVPKTKFLIVGDGPERGKIESLVESLDLSDHFQFVGFQKDVAPYYHSMDVLVLPSHREGFPMVLLEAMQLSKPVVATDVGGVSEIVVDGINGYLCREGSSYEIANAIIKLLRDKQLRDQFGSAAKAHIAKNFTVFKMAAAYDREYSLVLKCKDNLFPIEGVGKRFDMIFKKDRRLT